MLLLDQQIQLRWAIASSIAIVLSMCYGSFLQVEPIEQSFSKPSDYAYDQKGSRVRNLADFYESIEHPESFQKVIDQKNSILSLAETASRLHLMADGLPIDVKCSKYIRLISHPNIRNVTSVNALLRDEKNLSETLQEDANIQAILAGEKKFDALGRIHTIILALESESTSGRSSFEPVVQKDLLDCLSYLVFRHQSATFKVVEHVRESLDALPKDLIESSASEVIVKQYQEPIDKIKQIESESESGPFNYLKWFKVISELQELIAKNDYMIPESVKKFLNQPVIIDRLARLDEAPRECESIMKRIVRIENDESLNRETNGEYRKLVSKLKRLSEEFEGFLDEKVKQFMKEFDRIDYATSPVEPDIPPSSYSQQNASKVSIVDADKQDKTRNKPEPMSAPDAIEQRKEKVELLPDGDRDQSINKNEFDESSRTYKQPDNSIMNENSEDTTNQSKLDALQADRIKHQIIEPNDSVNDETKNHSIQNEFPVSLADKIKPWKEPNNRLIHEDRNELNDMYRNNLEYHTKEFASTCWNMIRIFSTTSHVDQSHFTKQISETLEVFNTDCVKSNFLEWTGNEVLVMHFERRNYMHLQMEVAKSLKDVCVHSLNEGWSTLSSNGCNRVSQIFKTLRKKL